MAWKTQLIVLIKFSTTSFIISYFIISLIFQGFLPTSQADKLLPVLYFQGVIVIVVFRRLYINKFDMIKIKDIPVIGSPKIDEREKVMKDIFFEFAFLIGYFFFIKSSSPRIMQELDAIPDILGRNVLQLFVLSLIPCIGLNLVIHNNYVDRKVTALQTCGCCGDAAYSRKEIDRLFGFRRGGIASQPWCRQCRSKRCKKSEPCKRYV